MTHNKWVRENFKDNHHRNIAQHMYDKMITDNVRENHYTSLFFIDVFNMVSLHLEPVLEAKLFKVLRDE